MCNLRCGFYTYICGVSVCCVHCEYCVPCVLCVMWCIPVFVCAYVLFSYGRVLWLFCVFVCSFYVHCTCVVFFAEYCKVPYITLGLIVPHLPIWDALTVRGFQRGLLLQLQHDMQKRVFLTSFKASIVRRNVTSTWFWLSLSSSSLSEIGAWACFRLDSHLTYL